MNHEQVKSSIKVDAPLTEILLLNVKFLGWISANGEANWRRVYTERNPRAYWDSTEVYTLSIHCKENYHGDYYLHLSRMGLGEKWFCFLVNGRWSETFIHLRHISHFSELHEIVWALTRCNVFESEYSMKEYVKQYLAAA